MTSCRLLSLLCVENASAACNCSLRTAYGETEI